MKKSGRKIKLLIASLLAILLWQIIAMKIDSNVILATPVTAFKRLFELFKEPDFLSVLLFSTLRIVGGLVAGLLCGIFLAVVAGKWENVEIFLKPFVVTVKSVPVASFVVLSLLWFGSENLSPFISFLMVFPLIYSNVLQGIKSLDIKMIQMAQIFKMPFGRRIKYLWIPSVKPFLISGATVASGLAWKSGVAAEIIGIPDGSIGEMLYESKVYLETETLLAWTFVIIVLSVCTEKLFILLIKGIVGLCFKTPYPTGADEDVCREASLIKIEKLKKSFGEEKVLEDFTATFSEGVSVIEGASGSGKTTLLNIILGIEDYDSGKISGVPQRVSAVFQEDRLCEDFTPLANVVAVTGKKMNIEKISEILLEMGLEKEDIFNKKVSSLSGGMKRRVSICRALCAEGDLVILDEPFKGLDENTKKAVIDTVKKHTSGRTVILVTHDEREAELINATYSVKL